MINYLQRANEVAQLATPSCGRPQPVTDNGVRYVRSNWLVVTPPPTLNRAVPAERHLHSINPCRLCQELDPQPSHEPRPPFLCCRSVYIYWLIYWYINCFVSCYGMIQTHIQYLFKYQVHCYSMIKNTNTLTIEMSSALLYFGGNTKKHCLLKYRVLLARF